MFAKSSFARLLSSEILDELDEEDPRAVHSRQDLQRINWIMGAAGILARALDKAVAPPMRIIEFGAGDGSLMLRLAKRFAPRWPNVQVVLLDRQNVVTQSTRDGFANAGWAVRTLQIDIDDWVADPAQERSDFALANLFIHHFDAHRIARLFKAISVRSDMFIACEPRRAQLPLLSSHMVGLLGANAVTRTDAVSSVKAGFRDQELSALWPSNVASWEITEQRAGMFSHLFVARRR